MDRWFSELMAATAWEMAVPRAYGTFHLSFTVVGLALSVCLAFALRNLGEKGNRRFLMGTGLFLAACEIYKQLFYCCFIHSGSYAWWIFPFQLCSVPMYLCILAPLVKGRLRQGMYDFMMIYNLLGGFMAFIEPSGINHGYWTLTLHAYIWHMSLVFVGLYLLISGRGRRTMAGYRGATWTFLALCGVAFCINLLLWRPSGGDINMFFVGPKNSSLIVFKQISEQFGWYISTLLYIPTVCLGAYLLFLPVYLWERKHPLEDRKTIARA